MLGSKIKHCYYNKKLLKSNKTKSPKDVWYE